MHNAIYVTSNELYICMNESIRPPIRTPHRHLTYIDITNFTLIYIRKFIYDHRGWHEIFDVVISKCAYEYQIVCFNKIIRTRIYIYHAEHAIDLIKKEEWKTTATNNAFVAMVRPFIENRCSLEEQ